MARDGIKASPVMVLVISWIVRTCTKHQMVGQHIAGVEVGGVVLGRSGGKFASTASPVTGIHTCANWLRPLFTNPLQPPAK